MEKSGQDSFETVPLLSLIVQSPLLVMSKRIRIFTSEDVAHHKTATSCWITRQGRVYDVTPFLNDHPGGDDLLLKYAGQDVDEVMKDQIEHEHSDSAYDMLEEFAIGRLGNDENTVSDGKSRVHVLSPTLTFWFNADWEATDDFHPDNTDTVKDYEKNQFLDLRKPLLRQVWEANFRYVLTTRSGSQT
jgi:4-hydroxysphinganine ceramide fatty acyl 2-hydroxylase